MYSTRGRKYHFDSKIYANRVFDSHGVADPSVEIKFGPNIKDWPEMQPLPQNLLLKVVSEIHDPVTTTDELFRQARTLLTVLIHLDSRNLRCQEKIRDM